MQIEQRGRFAGAVTRRAFIRSAVGASGCCCWRRARPAARPSRRERRPPRRRPADAKPAAQPAKPAEKGAAGGQIVLSVSSDPLTQRRSPGLDDDHYSQFLFDGDGRTTTCGRSQPGRIMGYLAGRP